MNDVLIPCSMTLTVRDATFELLRALQLTTIFGNPGSTEEPFLKNFPNDFRYVLGLQEATAIAMADGYSQATRRPALVNLHTAPGVGNALGNLATVFQNKTPVIITAGQQCRQMMLLEPWLINREATTLPHPWVKWSYEPARAADVPAALMRAYAAALQPPAGPVFLSIPLDDWDQPALGPAVVRQVSRRVAPDAEALAQVVAALRSSKHPSLVLGAAVDRSGGWGAAVALAEKTGMTVYSAPACERTPFPEDHPLYAGALPFAIKQLAEKLQPHDVVVVLGAPVFRYYPYVAGSYLPEHTRLFHFTDDPEEAARAPVGDSVLGDACLALEALVESMPAQSHARPSAGSTLKKSTPKKTTAQNGPYSSVSPMPASVALAAIRAGAPTDAILTQEAPSSLAALREQWPINTPETYYTMSSGGLGWTLPAAAGLAMHEKDSGRKRVVLAWIGDGSLQYAIQSLWTAAQHKLHLVVLVARNGQYGILKSFAETEKTPGVPGLDLPGLDCTALARGYGCRGQRVSEPQGLTAAVTTACSQEGPTLIEVDISAEVGPLIH